MSCVVSHLFRDSILIMLLATALAGKNFSTPGPLPDDLKGQCVDFVALDFLGPYKKAEGKKLTKEYFGDAVASNSSVVFAQRGSCVDYKHCFLAQTSAFATCRALKAVSGCLGGSGNIVSILFDNCTRNQCEVVMNPSQTRCMYKKWREDDGVKKAKGTCIADPDDTLLRPRPLSILRPYNGSHCLLPLPKGSKIFKQIECRDPGNEPWFRWWYNFTVPLSKKPYACLLLSSCKAMEDPMDFLCLSGKDAIPQLRRIAKEAPDEPLEGPERGNGMILKTAASGAGNLENCSALVVPPFGFWIGWASVVVVITVWAHLL